MVEQSSKWIGQLGLTIDRIRIGDTAAFSKTLTEADVYQFAGIVGDFNPLYVNAEYAAKTPLQGRAVPTMLVASLVSKVLGMQLPGPGTVHVAQEMEFLQPVHMGDTVEARVWVTRLDGKRGRVWLDFACTNQKGELVARGETEAQPPSPNAFAAPGGTE